MDSLDLFFKKYSYKFPKGYPDLNDEQDINILADLLEGIGVNLEEKKQKEIPNRDQLDLFMDEEIKDLIASLDDDRTKKKILNILRKANRKEDIHDEDEKKKTKNDILEILAAEKKLAKNHCNAVYRMALDFGESEKLLNYLKSPTVTKIDDSGDLSSLFGSVSLSDDFKEELINYYSRSTGRAEISLITFIKGCTARGGEKTDASKGDINLNGNIEVKYGSQFQLVPFKIAGYGIKPVDFLKDQTNLDFTSKESWPDALQNFWKNGDVTTETVNKIIKELYKGYVEEVNEGILKKEGLLNHISYELFKRYMDDIKIPLLAISEKTPHKFTKLDSDSIENYKKLTISKFSDIYPRFSYSA